MIILPIERLRQLNGEAPLQGFTLYLHHPEQSEDFAKSLETRLAPYQLKVRNNIGLRNEVLRIFDETFRITYALQAIALLVSVGTLLNTLSMLALERTREFAVFRAIGASARTIITMILAESLLLALLGFLGGVALGLLLSVILVYVVNVHFFGWSIAFHVPLFPFLSGGVLLLLLGSFVGIVHGRKMIRTLSGELLRYE